MAESNAQNPRQRMRPCPICSKLSTPEEYPFCSDRCRKVDLNRWFTEGYTIPVVETDDIDDIDEDGYRED
ncbi:DNA gyrase inhibitor YacG [Roseibium salinum]|uniref:DNA gyrase inhibitor YacG n=1 Tax=Roseibium salinum TaxID=1604349 RepID=A0ABT3R303_9HYPH|nr:DNA gyrase inhibitor YacG [Roseibium sp. DSM 29163]MCX2723574.1 DNA gyrase inhibitor YacG [Roseibium sp. DSM 29163]MDN3718555.1 DNA gyrase inhibitor YacG [Roseibium salinum]